MGKVAASFCAVGSLLLLTNMGRWIDSAPTNKAVISQKAEDWRFQYSRNVPSTLRPQAGAVGYVDWPSQDGIHMLVTATSGKISSRVWTAFTIANKSADAAFQSVHKCGDVDWGTLRLYLQRRGDDMSAAKEFHRWWTTEPANLNTFSASGMSASLSDLGKWGSVLGKTADKYPSQFKEAYSDLMAVGFGFGGRCFAAHGNYVNPGTARFVLQSFNAE